MNSASRLRFFVPFSTVTRVDFWGLLSAPFLWLEYRRPGFPEDSYGFDLAERMRLGSYGLDYVTNLAPEDYLAKATTGPANTPAFLQSEIQHMHDVNESCSSQPSLWRYSACWP